MTNTPESPKEQPPVDQPLDIPLESAAFRCLHCPILQHCMAEIETLQELPPAEENIALITSYARFYQGVRKACHVGPQRTIKRRFLVAGPEIVEIECGSALSRLHRDISTSRRTV